MIVLVAGSGGNIGGALVPALLDRGHEVRALVHSESGAAALPGGAIAIEGDLNDGASLRDGLDGAEGAFLLSGYDDAGIVAELERAGIERAVLLSGSSATTGKLDNAVAAYQLKSERALERSAIAATFLRPNSFMSNALAWADPIRAGEVVRAPFAAVAIAVNDPADVAAVAAVALTKPGYEGAALRISGPEALTPAARVAILGQVLGREIGFEAQSNARARTEMSESMPPEYVDAFFEFFVDGIVDETTVTDTVEDVTGRPPRSFRDWAEANAAAFR